MTIQDHSSSPDSNTLLHEGNDILLDDGAQTITEGHIPKIRKPYTMTKQRERWTDEEHNNFLEALKLYGRAWRKIEEHVGTKTAVQIRSHAQKFFSKVVREPNNIKSSIKPTEIPPPRPKKKPIHPYPRKHVIPVKIDLPLQEQSTRSASPNSSLDQENQSPTTVLCVVVSDTVGSSNSSSRDGSSSPVSSHGVVCNNDDLPVGGDPVVQENVSQMDKPIPVKLEPVPNVNAFTKEGTVDSTSPKILKLFGKTVLLENLEKTSLSSPCFEEKSSKNEEESLDRPSPMEVCTSAPVPVRTFCGGMPFQFIPLDNLDPPKEEFQEPKTKKEGSSPGLNIESVEATVSCARNWDTEMTQSVQCSLDFSRSLCAKLKRDSSENYTRAFVPYKRNLSERATQSPKLTGEESEPPRTRLCLNCNKDGGGTAIDGPNGSIGTSFVWNESDPPSSTGGAGSANIGGGGFPADPNATLLALPCATTGPDPFPCA
ncbi:hypothetical protein V2J09_008197 [Rumex salicifolius]